jgi:dienelactone hydrolase
MKKNLFSTLLACTLAASLSLSGCGSGGSSVQGSATPVPGTDVPTPPPDTDNTPPSPAPVDPAARFTGVAPTTAENPKYVISPAIQYDLGTMVASSADEGQPATFAVPVQGWLRYPVAAASAEATDGRFPIVLFLHGQHVLDDPSYQGYDYLAQDLARQGYVVMSLDANAINGTGLGDGSSQSRAQLLLGTLDRMRQIDSNGGPGVLSALRGKLDFDRIGIMGHSRGGQGVAYAIKFNTSRKGVTEQEFMAAIAMSPGQFSAYPDLVSAVGDGARVDVTAFNAAMTKYNVFYAAGGETAPPYNIRAGLMLAPTDFSMAVGVTNVPLAVVAPTCDGDVMTQDGAHAFDTNRFSTQYDSAPRFQVVVKGGNHNYFNTKWVADDAQYGFTSAEFTDYCSATRADSPRLAAEDQRRVGTFVVNSFMRYFVGGDAQFASYWNGTAQLPPAACPGGQGSCDERVLLTVQKDASQAKVVQRFESASAFAPNAFGGALLLSGFDQVSACAIPYAPSPWNTPLCNPVSPVEFTTDGHVTARGTFGGGGYLSISDALRLTWSNPDAKIGTDLKGASAAAYDSLTFRVAVVRPAGQEVAVTLTDTKGKTATVNASDFSDALYLEPKAKGEGRPLVDDANDDQYANNGTPVSLLNMVAIPLAAFKGVDKTSLARVEFTMPKAAGMIAFTDLEFQNLGRPSK